MEKIEKDKNIWSQEVIDLLSIVDLLLTPRCPKFTQRGMTVYENKLIYLILILLLIFPYEINAKIYGSIFGKILDIETKEPIAGVDVRCSIGGKTISDNQGNYKIEIIESRKELFLQFKNQKYLQRTIFTEIPEGKNLNIDVFMKKGVSLSIKVLDKITGEPIPKAFIDTLNVKEVTKKEQNQIYWDKIGVVSNNNGEYYFNEAFLDSTSLLKAIIQKDFFPYPIPKSEYESYPKDYWFKVRVEKYAFYFIENIKFNKEKNILNFYLEKGYAISGKYITADDQPFQVIGDHNPQLNLYNNITNTYIDADFSKITKDNYKIFSIPPGFYKLYAKYPGYSEVILDIEVKDMDIANFDITFTKSPTIIFSIIINNSQAQLSNKSCIVYLLECDSSSNKTFRYKNIEIKGIVNWISAFADTEGIGYFDEIKPGNYKIFISGNSFDIPCKDKLTDVFRVNNFDIKLNIEAEVNQR